MMMLMMIVIRLLSVCKGKRDTVEKRHFSSLQFKNIISFWSFALLFFSISLSPSLFFLRYTLFHYYSFTTTLLQS